MIQAKNKKNATIPAMATVNKDAVTNPTSIASTIISSTITAPIQSAPVGSDLLHRPPNHQLHHPPPSSEHSGGAAPHIIPTRLELPILMDPLNANNYLISI